MRKLYSFDVFDTIFTRKTANPHGIFSIIQEELIRNPAYEKIPRDIRYNFFELRIQSERFARFFLAQKSEEITINQIYDAMNSTRTLSSENIVQLINLEKCIESENIVPIPNVISKIEKLLAAGENVIFVSDMYWDLEFINSLLSEVNADFSSIKLYLSSQIGLTKQSGYLFEYIKDAETIDYTNWVHSGDNQYSDYEVPSRYGICCHLINKELELLPFERAIIRGEGDSVSFQMLIGVSKNTRVLFQTNHKENVGVMLSGILLVSYVRWILEDVKKRGIKELYFIARDGYILKIIADLIISNKELGIETKYIYGSRKAWRLPSIANENIDIVKLYRASTPTFLTSIEKIASVFGMDSLDICKYIPSSVCRNRIMSNIDVAILFYYLNENAEFKKKLTYMNDEKRRLIKEYLRQEINYDTHTVAFVEVGGTGYTQKCLERILRDEFDGNVMTYFFQLYSAIPDEKSIFANFIPDGLFIKDAIEPLCRAPHGQTLGYKKIDDKIVPILDDSENDSLFKCGYSDYIDGIKKYVNIFLEYNYDAPIDRRIVRKCWDYYTHNNDTDIWDFVGEIPFETIGQNKREKVYAPKLSIKDIENIFGTTEDDMDLNKYSGCSINSSLIRCSKEERDFIEKVKHEKKSKVSKKDIKISNQWARIPNSFLKAYRGTRIVLYGAGKLGTAFWESIKENNCLELVLWADKKGNSVNKNDIYVAMPCKILETDFDYIILSVLDEKLALSIKQELINLGISEKKIIWFSPEELISDSEVELI